MKRFSWLVLFVCIVVCLVGIFDRDLWTPDEPRVAAISLEMSRSGDLVIPHLAGEPFLEKPPLYFAVAAGFIRLLGPFIGKTGAIRLTSVLWGLGVLLATFFLAKLLVGYDCAFLSTVLLATMLGFVENVHWVRVDIALFFFVCAAVWSFAKVYFAKNPWFCLPAGIFTAGAFLSKGLIGPIIIAIAWGSMIIALLIQQWSEKRPIKFFPFHHVLGFLVFIFFAGTWVLLLRLKGGELWQEWFWENHIGRLIGTSTHLGHMHAGEHLYYLKTIIVSTLPWAPLIFLWIWYFFADLWNHRSIHPSRTFLLLWSFGSLLLLSLSSTKRDVYLIPLLPALAVMGAEALQKNLPKWCKAFFIFWLCFCGAMLLALTTSPVWVSFLPQSIPCKLTAFLQTFTVHHLICGLGLAISVYLIVRCKNIFEPNILVTITALCYIGIFLVAGKAINSEKSMQGKIESFVKQIPSEKRVRLAGFSFSETMRGSLYYYGDLKVRQIKNWDRLWRILEGKDPEFDSVIVAGTDSLSELQKLPHRLLAEADPGSFGRKRTIQWIKGIGEASEDRTVGIQGEMIHEK